MRPTYAGSYRWIDLGEWAVDHGFWPSLILISFGVLLSLMSIVAVVGELVNRVRSPARP